MKKLLPIIAIIQLILGYLGVIALILGIVALIYSNTNRGIELLIGSASFIVIRYIFSFIYVLISKKE